MNPTGKILGDYVPHERITEKQSPKSKVIEHYGP